MLNPEEVARAYFACMLAGDPAVVELFADDAVLCGLGRRIEGRTAVREFYERAIADAAPQPRVTMLLADAQHAVAELWIGLADGSEMHVLDLFDVTDGQIQSLTYFVADHPARGSE